MTGCVKEGTEARDIGEVGVIGLSDTLHQGGMSRRSPCLGATCEVPEREGVQEQALVGFVVWRPLGHQVEVSPDLFLMRDWLVKRENGVRWALTVGREGVKDLGEGG